MPKTTRKKPYQFCRGYLLKSGEREMYTNACDACEFSNDYDYAIEDVVRFDTVEELREWHKEGASLDMQFIVNQINATLVPFQVVKAEQQVHFVVF